MPAEPTLDILTPSRDGETIEYIPVTLAGDSFLNTGKEIFIVRNDGESAINITVPIPFTVDAAAGSGLAVTSRVASVDPAERKVFGPYPPNIYNDADGLVNFSYNDDTDVSIVVIRLP
jgi:hypothetical protein